jgi:2-iminobutanoate/2-iminopropanoate deaminase
VTSGQVAYARERALVSGDMEDQTRQVFVNLRLCLEAAGCGLDDVIKVNAFLTDLGNFETFNRLYREAFSEPYPARTTVQAGLGPGVLLEVEAVARRPHAQ